jgi:hypothetical protein
MSGVDGQHYAGFGGMAQGMQDQLAANGDPAAIAYRNYSDSYGSGVDRLWATGGEGIMPFSDYRRLYYSMNPQSQTDGAGTGLGTPPPPVPMPTIKDPSAFEVTVPTLPGAAPTPTPGAGAGGAGPAGLNALLNPYLLYMPQGRQDAAFGIGGYPGMAGSLGAGAPAGARARRFGGGLIGNQSGGTST